MKALDDPILEALHAWRDDQITLGKLRAGALNNSKLTQVLRSGYTDADEIAEILPDSVQWAAAHLARILALPRPMAAREEKPAAPAPDPVRADHDTASTAAPPIGGDSDSVQVSGLSVQATATGHRLSWPAAGPGADRVVRYRVTALDDEEPYRADGGRVIGETDSNEIVDTAPLINAVRFVAVWRFGADTVEQADARPAVAVARGHITCAPVGFTISTDHGSVAGQWSTLARTRRVRVYREPVEAGVRRAEEPYRILADQDNLTGFTDTEAVPGVEYVYRAVSEIDAGEGTILSEPVFAEAAIPGDLRPVTDLAVTETVDGEQIWLDLAWTPPPTGTVSIYRTAAKPPLSLSEEAMDRGSISSTAIAPDARLDDTSLLPNPVVAGVVSRMTKIAWPQNWVFVHLTPVTTVGDQVQVGATVTAVRDGSIRAARIIERCDEQFITLTWPEGTDEVRVHLADQHIPVESAVAEPPDSVMHAAGYDRDGGLRLPDPLPARGCAVHLVPVTYSGGLARPGAVTTVAYPGLLRVRYEIGFTTDKRRERWLVVKLASELDVNPAPPFVLVHREDRIPLHRKDGHRFTEYHYDQNSGPARMEAIHPMEMRRADDHLIWRVRIEDRRGFVRLFADINVEHQGLLALLDPPVRTLWITDPPRGR
ncbi:hypothetical protein [Nocardia bovistercoris]|uniref:Uncharacterized protein n=1 Tax=Nocardia bovistercoris TaxID=2785916 RepID=A0A931IDE0_9NOCA|nr:hypothetical protein [Nocardia bovistercoris]MBH0779607.1 hypothetical protein [Nocardia bovistercoris]